MLICLSLGAASGPGFLPVGGSYEPSLEKALGEAPNRCASCFSFACDQVQEAFFVWTSLKGFKNLHWCLDWSWEEALLTFESPLPLHSSTICRNDWFKMISLMFHYIPWWGFTFFFCLFRATPTAYGRSNQSYSYRPIPQPEQCRIWAVSATYVTAHSNYRSLTHWARPGIEPVSSWILVGFVNHGATVGTLGFIFDN